RGTRCGIRGTSFPGARGGSGDSRNKFGALRIEDVPGLQLLRAGAVPNDTTTPRRPGPDPGRLFFSARSRLAGKGKGKVRGWGSVQGGGKGQGTSGAEDADGHARGAKARRGLNRPPVVHP